MTQVLAVVVKYGKRHWKILVTHAHIVEKKKKCEHLIQFNREEYGLHIPANLVPSCNECNKKRSVGWEEWLKKICKEKGHSEKFEERKKKIQDHIDKHGYPKLTNDEKKVIADFVGEYYTKVSKEAEDKAKELVSKLEKKH